MRSLKTSIIGACVLLFLVATVPGRIAVSQKSKPPTGQANVAATDDEDLAKCPIDTEVPPCDTPICVQPAPEEARSCKPRATAPTYPTNSYFSPR